MRLHKKLIEITALVLATLTNSAPDAVAALPSPAQESQVVTNSGTVVSPDPVRSIGLAACFSQSDRVNREILSATWNLNIARANVRIAAAVPNLQLSVQTGFGNSFQYVFDGQTQDYFLTQEFQTAGKRSKKMAVARANYGLAELQLDALRFDVHNRVRRAYAELAAAEAYEALINSQREVGIKLRNISAKRVNAGKAAQSEMLQANLNVLQYDTQMNQAQGRLEQDSAALTQIIGEKPDHIEVIDVQDNGIFKLSAEKTEIVPQPSRPLPLLGKLLATAYYSRPDLKAAQQQVFVNTKALILAKTKKIPDLFLGVGGTYSTFTRNQPAGLNATGNWIGTGVFINVSVENPLFYQYQGETQLAAGNLLQSRRQVDLLKSQIATDLVTAYNALKVARANIFEYQQNLLPTASDVARVARRGYEVGATDLATAIVAQQQYQQTLANYFDAVVAYQTAWADMEKAVGVPLRL